MTGLAAGLSHGTIAYRVDMALVFSGGTLIYAVIYLPQTDSECCLDNVLCSVGSAQPMQSGTRYCLLSGSNRTPKDLESLLHKRYLENRVII